MRKLETAASAKESDNFNIREALILYLSQAIISGEVFWQKDRVIDRQIYIDAFPVNVRFVPTFAYRRLLYDKDKVSPGCPICMISSDGKIELPFTQPDEPKGPLFDFEQFFSFFVNNFPYLNNQFMLTSVEHKPEFSYDDYLLLLKFMATTGFAGASLQLLGSGATIPEHAHISIFDEQLPIFSLRYEPVDFNDQSSLSYSTDHPSAVYMVDGKVNEARLDRTFSIVENLLKNDLSFNLYIDQKSRIYLVPRTNRRSKTLDIKVGSSLPAGFHNGYAEKSESLEIEALEQEIWEQCQNTDEDKLRIALEETTLPRKDALSVIK